MPFTANVITTKEWGANPPRDASFRSTVLNKLTIHHAFQLRNLSEEMIKGDVGIQP
jgi:hypothetical protein